MFKQCVTGCIFMTLFVTFIFPVNKPAEPAVAFRTKLGKKIMSSSFLSGNEQKIYLKKSFSHGLQREAKQIEKMSTSTIAQRAVAVWNHPAGPKTIHFWAPAMKWALVIAGLSDINRPVEKLSVTQTGGLALTGVIWSRYAMVIIPKNWSLFSVNIFVAAVNLYQCSRLFTHHFLQDVPAPK